MKIVVPKETFPGEKRVCLIPSSIKPLVEAKHEVFVQSGAGNKINFPDDKYVDAGASIINDRVTIYDQAKNGMIITLKSPSYEEFSFMNNAILFCMLHISQNKDRLYYMGSQNLVGVAMEELRDEKDKRIIDQTNITGEMGVYYSLRFFQKIPSKMKAIILGYGNVAHGAINACAKLGIEFKIMRKIELKKLPLWLSDADLLINAISWPEKSREIKEYLVTKEDIKKSKPGMIVLDLAVDFPNPIETVHPTNYLNPFYIEEDRVHVSIYGYPGLAPVTSSEIYSEQLLPIALAIANNGGLADIERIGSLGVSIHNAVEDPSRYGDWKQYKPLTFPGSRIE